MKKLIAPALAAGLAGGLAEIAWIAIYGTVSPVSAADVGREITATVISTAADVSWAPWAGAFIHMALSLALGIAFVLISWRLAHGRPSKTQIWSWAVTSLVAVWAVNFFLVLPAVNPAFVTLLPLGATLLSRALFGMAMAWVLQGVPA